MSVKKIGIVVADSDEFAPLEAKIKSGEYRELSFLKRKILVFALPYGAEAYAMLCGIGKVNAAAAATHLIDIGCEVLLNYGLSGGISGIRRGEICLCTEFLEHDFNLTSIGYKPCEKPGQAYIYKSDSRLNELIKTAKSNVIEGTAVTGDCFVSDEKLRDFLKGEFGARCCDMETAAIAYVAEFGGIPFAALRRISDDAGDTAGESYREMNTSGETDLSDLILDIASLVAEKY